MKYPCRFNRVTSPASHPKGENTEPPTPPCGAPFLSSRCNNKKTYCPANIHSLGGALSDVSRRIIMLTRDAPGKNCAEAAISKRFARFFFFAKSSERIPRRSEARPFETQR